MSKDGLSVKVYCYKVLLGCRVITKEDLSVTPSPTLNNIRCSFSSLAGHEEFHKYIFSRENSWFIHWTICLAYQCVFSLFLFSVYLLSVSDFESTSNWGVGKKREEDEIEFSLKLVYLEKSSVKDLVRNQNSTCYPFFCIIRLDNWMLAWFLSEQTFYVSWLGWHREQGHTVTCFLHWEMLICCDLWEDSALLMFWCCFCNMHLG